ncbi:MAG TPA: hypothetical protein VIA62_06490 [Thermoanaerobaculia bacterium]|jgi:hypothetical protein|nr:hypothetical protein [Thermoanaerobaculia bacterium]
MRLSAADCLRRGWTNLAANWELVLLQWCQSLLIVILLALSVSLPVVALGADALLAGRSLERVLAVFMARLGRLSPAVTMAGVAMLAVWLLSLLVHCWFQAGTYGVLAAAERQALPGPRRHRLLFRTFSLRDFAGWGGLYLWRFFRLLVLFWALALPLGIAALVWLVSLGVGGEVWGRPAVLGMGCGGALPLGFLFLVAGLWSHVARAGLAREGSGVRVAVRQGLAVLGRRLGTVVVLVLLAVIAGLALALVLVPVSVLPELLLTGAPRLRALVRVVLFLLQGIPSALLALVLASSLVALVRSEGLRDIRRQPEVQTA